jgi:hypothetical protein
MELGTMTDPTWQELNALYSTALEQINTQRARAEAAECECQALRDELRGLREPHETPMTPEPEPLDDGLLKWANEWPIAESDAGDQFSGDLLIHKLADEVTRLRRSIAAMKAITTPAVLSGAYERVGQTEGSPSRVPPSGGESGDFAARPQLEAPRDPRGAPMSQKRHDDDFLPVGVRSVGPIEIVGHWDDTDGAESLAAEMLKQRMEPVRRVVINPTIVRLFGIDWRERDILTFEARTVTTAVPPPAGEVVSISYETTFDPVTPVASTPAEWWRRLGYRLIAQPFDRLRSWLSPSDDEA